MEDICAGNDDSVPFFSHYRLQAVSHSVRFFLYILHWTHSIWRIMEFY